MTTIDTARPLGPRMRAAREERCLSVEGAAAQARISWRLWDALEEFGELACTDVTVRRVLDWLDA